MKLLNCHIFVIFFISVFVLGGSNFSALATNSPFGGGRIGIPQSSNTTTASTSYDENVVQDDQAYENDDIKDFQRPIIDKDSAAFIGFTKMLRKMVIRANFEKPDSKNDTEDSTGNYLDKFSNIDIDIDGDNYCGQFAMTTILKGYGIEADENDIYKQSNPAGIFTAPPVIVETLRANGIDASKKHGASVADITKRIDDGKPVMVLVDSGGGVPHWICIIGYDKDSKGNIISLRMRDSYWGTQKPFDMDIKRFKEAWAQPLGDGILGDIANYKNLLIDIKGKADPTTSSPLYPSNFETATEDNIGGALNDIVTGWKNGGVAQVIGGVTKIVTGLPSAILGVTSNYLGKKSEKLISNGKTNWEKGGFLNKLKGGAAIVGGGIGQSVSKTGKVVADVGSSIANVTGNAIKKLGSLFS